MSVSRRKFSALGALLLTAQVWANGRYDFGANDGEIKIGSIMPYSGPASIYGLIGTTHDAYFEMLNEKGGINGRKINYISYDDGYSSSKTMEQVRRLVERDKVLAIVCPLGTAPNAAIIKYLNSRKVPHLFHLSGSANFSNPEAYPWTVSWIPSSLSEGRAFGRDIIERFPGKKVGVLYQNDDFGKDFISGMEQIFGDSEKSLIVAKVPYETTDPTVDSQVVNLRSSGAEVVVLAAVSKFVTQSLRKAKEMSWNPIKYVSHVAISIDAVLQPAGLDAAKGLFSVAYLKEPGDPQWDNDLGFQKYKEFMKERMPTAPINNQTTTGYSTALAIAHVLQQAGNDLTRENVMRQALNIKDLDIGIALPGIFANTGLDDHTPFEQVQMIEFNGLYWSPFGGIISTGK